MVVFGVAVGCATVVEESPVEGDQAYVNPDTAEAPKVADVLLQSMVASDPALAVGVAVLTVTSTVSELEHPLAGFVTTRVYVVVVFGVAMG